MKLRQISSEEDREYIRLVKEDMEYTYSELCGLFGDERRRRYYEMLFSLSDWELNLLILNTKYNKEEIRQKMNCTYQTVFNTLKKIKTKLKVY